MTEPGLNEDNTTNRAVWRNKIIDQLYRRPQMTGQAKEEEEEEDWLFFFISSLIRYQDFVEIQMMMSQIFSMSTDNYNIFWEFIRPRVEKIPNSRGLHVFMTL